MNASYKATEQGFSLEDEERLKNLFDRSLFEFKIIAVFILVISLVLPFLPPKYSGNKAMLDIMSYGTAITVIVIILGITFLWSVYYMLYGLHKDLKQKIKVCVNTHIRSTGSGKYKGREFFYFSAAGLPYRLGRIPISKEEYGLINTGSRVIVNYSKFGKRLLSWTKV
jgi:hypothetical protein